MSEKPHGRDKIIARDEGGFRVLGKITKRLFPKGTETPMKMSRDITVKPKRKAGGGDDRSLGGKPGRKKGD